MRIIRKRRKNTPSIKSNATAITAHHHHHYRRQSSAARNRITCVHIDFRLGLSLAISSNPPLFYGHTRPSLFSTFLFAFYSTLCCMPQKRLFDSICFGWTFVLNDAHKDATSTVHSRKKVSYHIGIEWDWWHIDCCINETATIVST